jgi:complex III assembly factor LYRM7
MNTLSAARAEARRNFDTNRGLSAGSDETGKQIAHAEDVAKFLRENVVQGQAGDTENKYSEAVHLKQTLHFWRAPELRIHEHTERGDNEDIRKGRGKSTSGGVKCCSS